MESSLRGGRIRRRPGGHQGRAGRPLAGIHGPRPRRPCRPPPCDHFAVSGARWWKSKGEPALLEGLAVVDACLRIISVCRPEWWALENPVGRLKDYIGPAAWAFDPCDFGDPYTKRTQLWGDFTPPSPMFSATARNPVAPTLGSKMHTMVRNKSERSVTPAGFAKAFFEANP